MSLVVAAGLAKQYGTVPVLDDVSFTIERGITGLLGANGAGKTTILGLILGLHKPDGGRLEVLGHDPWKAGAEVRTRVGYAPEHHTLPPDLRAADFVRHVAELHGVPPEEAKIRASDALWLVELGEERFRAMGTMSTGQRQRVKLAQAIAHDPEFVLLDEPTDGLDPSQREVMLNLIRSLSTEFQMNIVLSSHLIDEVERVCDRAVIIGQGKTLAQGTVAELRGSGAAGIVAEIDGTTDEIDRLVADLAGQGIAAHRDGRTVTLSPADTDSDGGSEQQRQDVVLNRFRDACVAHGLGLVRLDRRRHRLEDVFLEHLL